jgi:hypothetical protein
MILAVSLASCGHPAIEVDTPNRSAPGGKPTDQWTLENYDAGKGYTFQKDGVSYLTTCFLIEGKLSKTGNSPIRRGPGYVLEGTDSFHLDVKDQAQCNELVPYLHKTVPVVQGEEGFSEFLRFTAKDTATLDFVITETK